jgi:hypothetical protein
MKTIILLLASLSLTGVGFASDLSAKELSDFSSDLKSKPTTPSFRFTYTGMTMGGVGFSAIGLHTRYLDFTFGINVSNAYVNDTVSGVMTLLPQIEFKYFENKEFASLFGLYYSIGTGKISGSFIDSSYDIGTTIGFEYKLEENLYLKFSVVALHIFSTTFGDNTISGHGSSDRALIAIKYLY